MTKDAEKPENTADLAAAEAQLTGGDLPITPEGAAADGSGAGGAASIEGQPVVKTAAELAGAEEGAPAQGAAKEAAGAVKIRFGDREYTPEELVKQTDVLAKMSTQASQASHFQKLHEDRTKRIEELEAKAKEAEEGKAAGEPAATPGITQEQKRGLFAGALKAIQGGQLGPEHAELANELPSVYVDEMIFKAETRAVADHLFKELNDLKKGLHGIQGEASRLTEEAENEVFRARYGGLLDTLAKDPLYEGLVKPEQRKAFTEFFAKRYAHLDDKDVDQELVAEAYWAWLYRIAPQTYRAMLKKAELATGDRGR
ncbi:MAG TPA: hypothetical protein VI700_04445, partial [Thermoanaerobaculaceae bacterium]|nr:hypothetical protein [Thermoanaerobaculaceae bacterium]